MTLQTANFNFIIDFESIDSLKKAIDEFSSMTIHPCLPDSQINKYFNKPEQLIDLKKKLLEKGIIIISCLRIILLMNKENSWKSLSNEEKDEMLYPFREHCEDIGNFIGEMKSLVSKNVKKKNKETGNS